MTGGEREFFSFFFYARNAGKRKVSLAVSHGACPEVTGGGVRRETLVLLSPRWYRDEALLRSGFVFFLLRSGFAARMLASMLRSGVHQAWPGFERHGPVNTYVAEIRLCCAYSRGLMLLRSGFAARIHGAHASNNAQCEGMTVLSVTQRLQ